MINLLTSSASVARVWRYKNLIITITITTDNTRHLTNYFPSFQKPLSVNHAHLILGLCGVELYAIHSSIHFIQ